MPKQEGRPCTDSTAQGFASIKPHSQRIPAAVGKISAVLATFLLSQRGSGSKQCQTPKHSADFTNFQYFLVLGYSTIYILKWC